MTRDEAIEIEKRKLGVVFDSADPDWKNKIASNNIDALIELGLLKVEEPTITAKISRFADRMKFEGSIDAFEILLSKYGLKIVEK